jgi:NADH-quinone oxidoreductase subunit J
MAWFTEHFLDILSLVLIAGSVLWLMPRGEARPKLVGLMLALAGVVLMASRLHVAEGPVVETTLFAVFAVGAVFSAILMITNRNPVYSALWFAMVTLNVCGLFLLQWAPFLAAATVIVYAGAIVVTFVFVIMLAQQSGATVYDQHARQPIVATIASILLLAMILGTLELSTSAGSGDPRATHGDPRTTATVRGQETRAQLAIEANLLSRPAEGESLGTMHGLGRSLFGDYLFAVELAGTLLLVATIGAIAIAPRRARGTL